MNNRQLKRLIDSRWHRRKQAKHRAECKRAIFEFIDSIKPGILPLNVPIVLPSNVQIICRAKVCPAPTCDNLVPWYPEGLRHPMEPQ